MNATTVVADTNEGIPEEFLWGLSANSVDFGLMVLRGDDKGLKLRDEFDPEDPWYDRQRAICKAMRDFLAQNGDQLRERVILRGFGRVDQQVLFCWTFVQAVEKVEKQPDWLKALDVLVATTQEQFILTRQIVIGIVAAELWNTVHKEEAQ